jgi:two-component system, NarL family, response regulator NreC
VQKPAKEIRILLADDHNVMRAGLKMLLESHPGFTVISEASDGHQAVENAISARPDVAVLDIAMPKLSGIEAAQRINAQLPQTAIIILSMHSDEGYVLRALKSGARGYLLKDSAESDLIQAIKAVSEGKAFFSPEISKVLADDYVREINVRGAEDRYDLLTPREREILQLLVEGRSNKDIAGLLNLSLYTIETHRRNLQSKLNLHSFPELILYAVRKGIIS